MAMPRNIIFIRHGLSEPNKIHALERGGVIHSSHKSVYTRADWRQRLSAEGITQAEAAGKWLKANKFNLSSFDRRYCSPYLRTRETAYNLDSQGLNAWILEDRVKERDWGEYGATPKSKRRELFKYTVKTQPDNKWYTRLDGGESLSDGVMMRVRDFVGTLHRDMPGKDVLVISHGEYMQTVRFVLEKMSPEQWMKADKDKLQEIKNCNILHYTRINPVTQEMNSKLSHFRIINPWDSKLSPYGGMWQAISPSKAVTTADLYEEFSSTKPLITSKL